jgi:hypothetical protein
MIMGQQQQQQKQTEPIDDNEEEDETMNQNFDSSMSMTTTTTVEEVLACQFSSWYPHFAKLKRATIPAVILDLPSEFMEFMLHTDQLMLPLNTRTSSALLEHANHNDDDDDSQWSSNSTSNENDNDDSINKTAKLDFTVLNRQIEDAIRSLGGAVAPKLNWSAPRDAVWINAGTMECRTPGDVYLLLKASDFCHYDLTQAVPSSASSSSSFIEWKPQLALRKWCHLYPSQEFRCFIHNQQLIAISQRNITQAWPHLVEMRETIQDGIWTFFQNIILPNYESMELSPSSPFLTQKFVMDVYMDQKQRVWLLDMNVWDARTDSLLFDWDEWSERIVNPNGGAHGCDTHAIDFRIVEPSALGGGGGALLKSNPLSSYRAPIDTLQLASDLQFRNFMNLCARPTAIFDSEDEDDDDYNY